MTEEEILKLLENCIDNDLWFEIDVENSKVLLNHVRRLQQGYEGLIKWLEDKTENHNKIIKAKEKDLKKWKEEFPHCDEKQTITYSQLRHLRYENDVYQEILDKVKENK